MSAIPIIFGTESGNAEMVADDIAEALTDAGHDAEVVPMEDFEVADLPDHEVVVVITSTYGEGELPETTAPFHAALIEQEPDLSSVRFAAFGLGDSTYETYNNAISILQAELTRLGAAQIGETCRHDAASGLDLTIVATEWVDTIAGEL
ncbi:FMN-binding protein MioC [Agromyces tropicus]|uniref:FMN-binding protein MioC n=1 Tax=Agromyces tropicus TaxID=555371 RepID=A0ABP5FHL4_9MICO